MGAGSVENEITEGPRPDRWMDEFLWKWRSIMFSPTESSYLEDAAPSKPHQMPDLP